jgi:hypothetical protein
MKEDVCKKCRKVIKVLVLVNNQILISQIEEVGADIGEPDCKLSKTICSI